MGSPDPDPILGTVEGGGWGAMKQLGGVSPSRGPDPDPILGKVGAVAEIRQGVGVSHL